MVNILEIKRKLFHLLSGLVLVILIDLGIFNWISLLIIFILGLAFSFLIKRKIRVPIVSWLLDHMDREHDLKKFPGKGPIYFVLGCLISVLLFEKNIALASIIILTIGDSVGALFGLHFGNIKNPLNRNKFIEGTIIGIILAFVGACIFVNYKEAFFGALFGMLIESIELRLNKDIKIDDNLTVPIVSGLVIYLLRRFG